MPRFMRYIITCALLALLMPGAALAQKDELEPIEPPAQVAPDQLAQARAAAERGDAAEALSRYLRALAHEPDNVAALTGAGRAALDIGDVSAAAGFFARAEDHAPRDGAVKAGLGALMTQNGNGRAALRFFREALSLGIPLTVIAADRGLAYDLVGQPRRAQADYMLALRVQPNDEVVRRLALSQAIGGDRAGALATLDPLLRKQDVPAWRARAFVYALTGDLLGAERDALTVMSPDQAEAIRPYLARLASLKPSEKAAAVDLGRFPNPNSSGSGQTRTVQASQAPVRTAQVVPTAPAPTLAIQAAPASAPVPERTAQSIPSSIQPPIRTARATPLLRQGPALSPAPASAPVLQFDRGVATSVGAAMGGGAPVVAAPPPPAPGPTKAELAAQAKADARERAAAKAKADAAAKAKKDREEEAAQRLAEKRQPERQWVQVAGGANKADLPKAWAKLKAQWPSQLAGKSPWTMHYRFTNRLLIGPFPSQEAAQDYVSDRRKEGFATFRVETPAGTPVERLNIK